MRFMIPTTNRDYIFVDDFKIRDQSFKCSNPVQCAKAGIDIKINTDVLSQGIHFMSPYQLCILSGMGLNPHTLTEQCIKKITAECANDFKSLLAKCYTDGLIDMEIPAGSVINFHKINSVGCESTEGKLLLTKPNNANQAVTVHFYCNYQAFNGSLIMLDPTQLML